jgi:hypothetical protein
LKTLRRGAHESHFDERILAGPGRACCSQQHANYNDDGESQVARSPIDKKIFHSESITEEFGQGLG